jgi:hypothetical protein
MFEDHAQSEAKMGRELLGFIWAIEIQAETAQKEPLRRAA